MKAKKSIRERLASGVDVRGECWVWNKSTTHAAHGYGQISIDGKLKLAHRVSYEEYVGPIPEGLGLDHLCRIRACINWRHLEPVTNKENCERGLTGQHNSNKTHCPWGHLFDEANTYWYKNNRRKCKACHNTREQRRREIKRSEAQEQD